MDPQTCRRRIDALRNESDPQRRRLVTLGLLTALLEPHDIEPILVGGGAVEFYTAGGYTTGDTDLALPSDSTVDAAFTVLGFHKEGRFWIRADLDLLFEAPAPAGLPGEDAPRTVLDVDGLRVVVIGIEDLILDRFRAWIHWKSDEDGRWTRRLTALYADRLDWAYLISRVDAVEEEGRKMRLLREEFEPRC